MFDSKQVQQFTKEEEEYLLRRLQSMGEQSFTKELNIEQMKQQENNQEWTNKNLNDMKIQLLKLRESRKSILSGIATQTGLSIENKQNGYHNNSEKVDNYPEFYSEIKDNANILFNESSNVEESIDEIGNHSPEPIIIRYNRRGAIQEKKNHEMNNQTSNENEELEQSRLSIPIPIKKPVSPPCFSPHENHSEKQNRKPNISKVDEDVQQAETEKYITVSFKDLELLIDRKMEAIRSEFSGELQKIRATPRQMPGYAPADKNNEKQESSQFQNLNENLIYRKLVALSPKIEQEDKNEKTNWMLEMLCNLKEENSQLKATLSSKEQEIKELKQFIAKLSEDKADAFKTIHSLSEEIKYLKSTSSQKNASEISTQKIKEEKPLETNSYLDDFPANMTNISDIIGTMESLDKSLFSRHSWQINDKEYQEETIAVDNVGKQWSSIQVKDQSNTNARHIEYSMKHNNTNNSSVSDTEHFISDNMFDRTSYSMKERASMDAGLYQQNVRSNSPSRSKTPNRSSRSTTPNRSITPSLASARTQYDASHNRQEYIAERLLRSLRGAPPPEANAREIDRMVEELKEDIREEYDIILPLKKIQDCVYMLGNRRKLHLNVVTTPFGRQLVVRLGGGYRDLLEYILQSLNKINIDSKKKQIPL